MLGSPAARILGFEVELPKPLEGQAKAPPEAAVAEAYFSAVREATFDRLLEVRGGPRGGVRGEGGRLQRLKRQKRWRWCFPVAGWRRCPDLRFSAGWPLELGPCRAWSGIKKTMEKQRPVQQITTPDQVASIVSVYNKEGLIHRLKRQKRWRSSAQSHRSRRRIRWPRSCPWTRPPRTSSCAAAPATRRRLQGLPETRGHISYCTLTYVNTLVAM